MFSRRIQRLLFFAVASMTLFYIMNLLVPDQSGYISPMVFSGTPPSKRLAPKRKNLKLDNVKGFFAQDLMETTADTFNVFREKDFGLLQQKYSYISDKLLPSDANQWVRFQSELDRMNIESQARIYVVGYKVLYLFRPPESWHHAGEAYYGEQEWNCRWTTQDGNGSVYWTDAQLTPAGVKRAKYLHTLWNRTLSGTSMAMPELLLSSPLSRAAETLIHAFNLEELDPVPPPSPIFVEFLRESVGVDTHNSRRTYNYLKNKYSMFQFEERFSENDPLWSTSRDEHDHSVAHRAKIFLENLFLRRKEVHVAIVTHESVIKQILAVTGHRPFPIPIGHMIPLVVKGSWVKSWDPKTEDERYKKHYRKNRNCTVAEPEGEGEEEAGDET